MSISKDPKVAIIERTFLYTGLAMLIFAFMQKIFSTPILDSRLIFLFPVLIYGALRYIYRS